MTSLETLYAQKAWANQELFDTLASAPMQAYPDALHAAIRTLNHIYVVDLIFRAHLSGEPHTHTATNTPDTPALGELHFAVAETDGWYREHVAQATPQALRERVRFRFTDGDAGDMTREEMLLHVITHGAYHRGNVGQILKSVSVAPPRDLLTKFLHLQEPSRRWA